MNKIYYVTIQLKCKDFKLIVGTGQIRYKHHAGMHVHKNNFLLLSVIRPFFCLGNRQVQFIYPDPEPLIFLEHWFTPENGGGPSVSNPT